MGKGKAPRLIGVGLLLLLLGTAAPQPPIPGTLSIFPSNNPWNWDVSGFDVHPNSDAYINSIGRDLTIQEDYSFYYSLVDDTQLPVSVSFNLYAGESDPGPGFGSPSGGSTGASGNKGNYRIPSTAQIEGNGSGDAHVLVVFNGSTSKLLYETYKTTNTAGAWSAGCGAIYDLSSNAVRPDGWTSADAAGLPIFPGLIRLDQASTLDGINHALRFTAPKTQNAHIYPARHDAGDPDTNLPPMGLRLRLKASVDLSGYSGVSLEVLKALKKYGMILADNGSAWYISTTDDSNWNVNELKKIRVMTGNDFEVVTTVNSDGSPVIDDGSGSIGPPPPPPPTGTPFGGSGGGCGLLGLEAVLLLGVLWRRAYFFGR